MTTDYQHATHQGSQHDTSTEGHPSRVGHADHGGHAGHGDHAAQFRDRFWLSLALSVPVVFTSHMVAGWLGYHVPGWAGWIAPVGGTIIYTYGGWPFLTGAIGELRGRRPGMMTLVALAITVAGVASALTTFGVGGLMLDFWWELALLVVIMLLGHWVEMRALGQASGALAALAELLPESAERLDAADQPVAVPLSELMVDDVVLVRSGGRVPADGTITAGSAELDEALITGESRPVQRGAGERVVAGTIATDSAIRVRVDAVGADTALAGIQRLVAEAQNSKSRAQALADRAAAALFYFAAAAGAITFAVWAALGDLTAAVERTVTVLVIACPHALGLAIPLVIAISTSMSARAGILVTDRLALERMRTVDAVLFDKTGTLTRGEPVVVATIPDEGVSETELLALAGAVESESEHPLAHAIRTAADAAGLVPSASEIRSLTGRGVRAVVEGREVALGGPALLRELDAQPDPKITEQTSVWAERGTSVLHVLRDGVVIGALALADEIRPESREAVRELQAAGVRVVMITGDARNVAESVGADLGVDEIFAEVLPADKDAAVAQLQGRGMRVAMVGDGVNDAPALARADVGIAIGAGTDVAIESAGVVLASDDPRGVLATRRLSQAGYRKMWQNLVWATGYNVLSVPLAAGALAGIGFVLPPAIGALAMSLSTIVVALNAQLLRRVQLRPGTSNPR